MAFNVENASGAALEISDLGITLETGEITDLAQEGSFDTILISAQAGSEISNLISSGDLIVKDPLLGTDLSIADALICARAFGDPHYRVGAGAVLGHISDITITTPADGEALTYDSGSGDWINSPNGGFSGLGIWRYRTAITSTPTSGQLQLNNLTIDLATELYINVTNDTGTDMSAFLALITSGSFIYIQIQADSTQFVAIEVGTSSLSAGVYTFPITEIEAQGTAPSNNTPVAVVASGAGGGGGGGSTIIVQDSGSPLTNTPHTTLNFTGDLAAVDAGAGVATISVSHPVALTTINGQLIPTFVDTGRASKVLSISESVMIWNDNKTNAGDWFRIGNADDAEIGEVMPLDGTIVFGSLVCENNQTETMGIDLYVNGVLSTADLLIITGAGNTQKVDRDETINIDFNQDDILHLRASLTGTGQILDSVITLWMRWRGV